MSAGEGGRVPMASPVGLRRRYLARMGVALWRQRVRPQAATTATDCARTPVRLLAVHTADGAEAARLLRAMLRSVGAEPEQLADGPGDLMRRLREHQPRALLVFGSALASELLRRPVSLGEVRGRVWTLPESDIPLVVTDMPESLLQNPAGKAAAWDDLKRLLHLLATETAGA